MLILNNEEVKSLLTMDICLEVVEDAYRELGEERAINQPRIDTYIQRESGQPEFRFKTMLGLLPKQRVCALRVNSDLMHFFTAHGKLLQDRKPALGWVYLYSTDTCEPLAIILDGYLQRMRVGAVNGLGAKYLAREDSSVLGILGSGWQARGQIEAISRVRKISRAKVYSPNPEHRKAFAEEMGRTLGIDISPVDEAKKVFESVDILDSATNAMEPLITGKALKEGMHVTTVTNEFDDECLRRADVKIIHCRDFMKVVAGPASNVPKLGYARSEGLENLPVLSDLILGKTPRRTNDRQITLFINNIGLGIQFAAIGAKLLQLAKEKNVGKEVPTEWFIQQEPYH